jgi:hypothetical protein
VVNRIPDRIRRRSGTHILAVTVSFLVMELFRQLAYVHSWLSRYLTEARVESFSADLYPDLLRDVGRSALRRLGVGAANAALVAGCTLLVLCKFAAPFCGWAKQVNNDQALRGMGELGLPEEVASLFLAGNERRVFGL